VNWRTRAQFLGDKGVKLGPALSPREDRVRPVKPVAEPGPQGAGKTIAHKGLQGATAGWSDRLMAAIARKHELVDPDNAYYRMPDNSMRKVESSEQLGDAVRDDERQTLRAMEDQRPVLAAGSQLAGGLGMQAALAGAGLPVFSTPGQVLLGGLEGVGQTEHDLDTAEGMLEAGVRGTGNAALGFVLGKGGNLGPRKLVESQETIDRLVGPARAAIRKSNAKVTGQAEDIARKAVHADHAKDLKAIEGMRAKIQDRILRDYEKAATDSGMSPEQAAKMLTANEQQIQDAIEAEYRRALYGDYAKANKAGVRAVRDVRTAGAKAQPEHAETLEHFGGVLQSNVDETLAKGVPTPPVKMTREQMLAEVAKRMKSAKARGVKAVRAKHGTPPVMPAEELEALTQSRIKALQESGRLPSGADLSDDEIEGLAAMKLGDPRFLDAKNPDLARKFAAGTPPLPPEDALAEGLSDAPAVGEGLAGLVGTGTGLRGRALRAAVRKLLPQSPKAAFDEAVRDRAVAQALSKYFGPEIAGGVRELATDESDEWYDDAKRRLKGR
jgi:hypothetical protein